MKLKNLFEMQFDESSGWDYLYRDCLLEMHRNPFNSFVRSAEGKNSKYKGIAFLDKQGERFKAEFLSDHSFLDKITFVGNVLNTTSSLEFYHYDELGGEPPFKIGTVDRNFSIQSAKTLTEIAPWFPEKCRHLYLDRTGVTSLHNIHKIVKECSIITLNASPIKSHIAGLMLIKNLTKVELNFTDEMVDAHPIDGAYNQLESIVRKNLAKNPRDIFEFQDELVEGGWEEYAKP